MSTVFQMPGSQVPEIETVVFAQVRTAAATTLARAVGDPGACRPSHVEQTGRMRYATSSPGR